MAIETICSGCGQKLAVADEHAGKRARCPACGQIYTVPFQSPQPELDATTDTPQPGRARHGEDRFGDDQTMGDAPPGRAMDSMHPGLAETSAGYSSFQAENSFWMQASDGAEYGPVDRSNLNRWFEEGRVGRDYQIRQGPFGPWQPAELFRPQAANPYSNPTAGSTAVPAGGNSPYNPVSSTGAAYQKGDPSGLILTMGILAWIFFFLGCVPIAWVPGLIAWLKGGNALQEIRSGIADPTNTSLVQVGYYLGMINVIVTLLMTIAFGGFIALSILAGL